MMFLALLGLIVAGALQDVAQAHAASPALLARAMNPNPALQSYTASAQLSARLLGPLPVSKTFPGTVYYLKPKRKIELQNVPGPLSKFKDMAASAPSYEQLMAQYSVTPLSDSGTASSYSLVPKKTDSRVKHITVTVDDASALITRAHWLYTDGGTLTFDQSYTTVANFQLPSRANIAARFPGYSVDGTLTFTNYNLNANVSPSVFASP